MTQAPDTPELVERLRRHVWLTPGNGLSPILVEAAAALEAQQARIAELEGELKAALREVGQHAREAGEAIGRLEMSEAAGIVDGWRERSDRYEKALSVIANASERSETMFGGKMSEVTQVFQHITRISRQALSSSQGRHEGGEDGLPELPCGVGPSDLTDPQSQHSDGEG